jgi:hypothetical protein
LTFGTASLSQDHNPWRLAMAALNHIIIPAKYKDASASFLADILG